jgi:DNA helicase-2/ATP-dependent DNA helicase PcrA
VQLTREQQQIVEHKQGHAKVSAVAGSGKTTAMVARVYHLLTRGVPPEAIRVFMFNKSARESFVRRMNKILAQKGLAPPPVHTFHSLGLRLVKSFTARGILPSFTLLTREYQLEQLAREAVKSYLGMHGGDESGLARENMDVFLTFIDLVKSDTRSVRELFDAFQIDERFDYFIGSFAVFEKMRTAAQVRFFSDLIHEPVLAMKNDQQLASWVGNRVDHIIVDEYQDINEVQQQLLRCIAGSRAEVMVVGDVDQCIYEWRGARPEYIVSRFDRDFPGALSYTLSYTFRFGHRLSLAANHLISRNKFRDRKLCLSADGTPDTRLQWLPENEPHPVLKILDDWQKSNRSLREAVVLVRLYASSVPVELALLENNIPYRLSGHEPVFGCPEILALMGYLYLCQGGLSRISNVERGIELVVAMLTNPHFWLKADACRALAAAIVDNPTRAADMIREQSLQAGSSFLAGRIQDLATVWEKLSRLPDSTKAETVLNRVIRDTDLFDFYHRFSPRPATAANKIRTCQAFVCFAARRKQDVNHFLADIERLRQANGEAADEHLLITSIHRAKGLEWPLVILPGLEDGSVPYRPEEGMKGGLAIEDERRLMYVGMTRTTERLCLLYPPDSRFERRNRIGDDRCPASSEDGRYPASCFLYESNLGLSDQVGGQIAHPSPDCKPLQARNTKVARKYLSAIQAEVAVEQTGGRRKKKRKKARKKRDWLVAGELCKKMKVAHKTLGIGTVKSIGHAQGVVTVEFVEYGLQNLVINLAKLRPVAGEELK